MSKADDMFKELGYKKYPTLYENKNTRIQFNEFFDWLEISNENENFRTSYILDKKVLLAINEKVKELGWYE